MRIIVWTEAYRPPIGVSLEAGEAVSIGLDLMAWVVVNPTTGDTFVAEASTGAFVGQSVKQVREDVKTADLAVIRQQLAAAKERRKSVVVLPADKFWSMFNS
jgi:fructose-1,6-bisphosphatase/inositol monophosphatase family enzyme